ncbi:hypothetical protein [Parafrankia discariae]|uniref:hypothetical protein n=1 Tax=Parafrankia discariae TaxID=365528 RepID=UPI001E4FEA9A|nr:hypothetical protein [Parafrankia discariae]
MTRQQFVRPSPRFVTGAFLLSGMTHLARPSLFEPLVPRAIPRPREVVYASGVAELACAAGLLTKASWAGRASAALLVGVWPGNLQMAWTPRPGPGVAEAGRVTSRWPLSRGRGCRCRSR